MTTSRSFQRRLGGPRAEFSARRAAGRGAFSCCAGAESPKQQAWGWGPRPMNEAMEQRNLAVLLSPSEERADAESPAGRQIAWLL